MTRHGRITWRMGLVISLFFIGFVYVGYNLYQVQIVRHEELFSKAKSMYTAKKTAKGSRGEIFDRDGNRLVCNLPVVDIVCDPSIVGDEARCREIAKFFANNTGADFSVLFNRLMNKEIVSVSASGERTVRPCLYAVIAKGLDLDLGHRLQDEVKRRRYHGFRFVESYRRIYPKDEMLANILGFTSIDQDRILPVGGLEKTFNKKMQSQESTFVYERARDGRTVSYGFSEGDPIRDGYDIYLTVREPVQAIVEEELDALMARVRPKAAYAVMADPYTGDIIAAAQRPTYNPNDRSTMSPDAYRNRIAEDVLEPGSIMKPFVIAAALDLGLVKPDAMIDCEKGSWIYARRVLHDSHNVGRVPLTEVIKQSSNIGTAKVSLLLGEKRLDAALRSFGFGSRTGVPLRPETVGIYRPLNKWDGLSITRFCIGQGIGASPLQLVRAYCMLANGGYPVNLRLVDRVEGELKSEKFPYVRGPCIYQKKDTSRLIHEMMKTVTEPGGTATTAAIRGYYVAGKTGTSEKFMNGAYQKRYFSSFCGFVPSDNPRFVLLVTCDEPTGSYYGGKTSAPAFAAIAERTLKYLRIPFEVDPEKWDEEWKTLKKKDYERRVRQDEEVRRRRAVRDASIRR